MFLVGDIFDIFKHYSKAEQVRMQRVHDKVTLLVLKIININ